MKCARTVSFLAITLMISALPLPLNACTCFGPTPVCRAFEQDDIVFIGRVESVVPDVDPSSPEWNRQLSRLLPNDNLSSDNPDLTPAVFRKLRDFYSTHFTGETRANILRASTPEDLESKVEEATRAGRTFRFSVQKIYKGLPVGTREFAVSTDFSSCGAQYIKGETYLVYTSRDESGRAVDGACSRSSRLTDAGEDLAYLHFVESGAVASTRLYGYVSAKDRDPNLPRLRSTPTDPRPWLIVELRSENRTLLSSTNPDGAFAFDGLTTGDYILSVFDDYVGDAAPLIAPRPVRITTSRCVEESFVIPESDRMPNQ